MCVNRFHVRPRHPRLGMPIEGGLEEAEMPRFPCVVRVQKSDVLAPREIKPSIPGRCHALRSAGIGSGRARHLRTGS